MRNEITGWKEIGIPCIVCGEFTETSSYYVCSNKCHGIFVEQNPDDKIRSDKIQAHCQKYCNKKENNKMKINELIKMLQCVENQKGNKDIAIITQSGNEYPVGGITLIREKSGMVYIVADEGKVRTASLILD